MAEHGVNGERGKTLVWYSICQCLATDAIYILRTHLLPRIEEIATVNVTFESDWTLCVMTAFYNPSTAQLGLGFIFHSQVLPPRDETLKRIFRNVNYGTNDGGFLATHYYESYSMDKKSDFDSALLQVLELECSAPDQSLRLEYDLHLTAFDSPLNLVKSSEAT